MGQFLVFTKVKNSNNERQVRTIVFAFLFFAYFLLLIIFQVYCAEIVDLNNLAMPGDEIDTTDMDLVDANGEESQQPNGGNQ